MILSTTASGFDAVANRRKVTSMKALKLLVAASAAAMALFAVSPLAEAQGPPGGSFRGAPGWHGGPGRGAPPPRTNVNIGIYGPGVWWGPGPWRGGWWGPGVWGPTWWGPGVWPGVWWGPGVWGASWSGPGVWVPGGVPQASVAAAPTYVERSPPAEPAAQVWWYWCAEARAYYPYVKECPGGWQRVAPQSVQPAGIQ
jgi:hypothetical protein